LVKLIYGLKNENYFTKLKEGFHSQPKKSKQTELCWFMEALLMGIHFTWKKKERKVLNL
jgi:hypothetical protein